MGNAGEKNMPPFPNSVNLNASSDFPYLVLDVVDDVSSPRNPGFRIMHWHEDLQLVYVWEGAVEVRTLDARVGLRAGEGALINRNVVHDIQRLGSCHYSSVLFPERLVGFYAGGPAAELAGAVGACAEVSCVRLAPEVGWQAEALGLLRRLLALERERTRLYPYAVLTRLSELWLVVLEHLELPARRAGDVAHARVREVLRCIEARYAEDLTLDDLAAAAHVSRSECERCFKRALGTTPYRYLAEYRLAQAARLLRQTSESVAAIAAQVGFGSPSHFGACFKAKTGQSPRTYRHAHL